MAKLERKLTKIFAENSGSQGTAVYGSKKMGNVQYSKDIEVLQNNKYQIGRSEGVTNKKAPVLQEENTIDYVLSHQIKYINQMGVCEWYDKETYYVGSVVNIGGIFYVSLQNDNINHNPLIDTQYWKLFTGSDTNSVGNNLFDPVFKDHLLTYEEKFGLELLGEYVYKTAVAGTRYGYPDFYNKVLAEYNDPNNTDEEMYISSNITKVGDIKDNKGVVNDFSSSKYFYTNKILNVENNPFEVIIKIKTGTNVNSTQTIISGNTSTTYPPMLIRIESGKLRIWLSSNLSGHNIVNGTTGTYVLATETDYYIKIEWTTTQYIISISTDNQSYTQDITVNSTTAINSTLPLYFAIYKTDYPFLGSFDLNETKITINNQLYWQGTNVLTYKKNINEHNFYNIADKDKADEIYNNTGIAWFYGVDTTNERIFLPRNNYLANDGRVVGNGKNLGITDGTYSAGMKWYNGGSYSALQPAVNTDNLPVGTNVSTASSAMTQQTAVGVSSNAEKSGLVNNAFGYIYICVGNVAQEEAQGQYIDFTTTENDTTPLFTAKIFEFDAGQKNPSWLRANGNYVSGQIYQTCYTELVNLLNYNPLHLKVVDHSSLDPNTDYSEYWIVNQTNQTFRTPLKTSERILVSKKEPTNDDTSWYNLYSDGWLEQGNIINDGSAGSRVISLAQSFKNTNYSLFGGAVYSSGGTGTNHQESTCEYIAKTNSSFTKYIFGDWIGTNKGYWWKETGYTNIPVNNINLFFKVANAVENAQLIDISQVLSELTTCYNTNDIETYENGTNGYYLDKRTGFCQQWGCLPAWTGNPNVTITLYKRYKNTNYNVLATLMGSSENGDTQAGVNTITVSQFNIKFYSGLRDGCFWKTTGFIDLTTI